MDAYMEIRDQAARWVVRLDMQGEKVEEEFSRWLHADDRHLEAYARALAVKEIVGARLQEVAPASAAVGGKLAGRSRTMWPYAAAAAIVAVAFAVVLMMAQGVPHSTAIGEIKQVELEDGTHVFMNTDSSIRVSYSESRRTVLLLRGEARFTVAPDKGRPFDVMAGSTVVHSIGTDFLMRWLDGRDLSVLVTEGHVEIGDDERRVPVQARELAQISDGVPTVKTVTDDEVRGMLQWQTGQITFERAPLATVVAELNRYNTRKLVIDDPSIATMPFSGTVRVTNTEEFADLLLKTLGIRSRITEKEVMLGAPRSERDSVD